MTGRKLMWNMLVKLDGEPYCNIQMPVAENGDNRIVYGRLGVIQQALQRGLPAGRVDFERPNVTGGTYDD